MSSIVDVYWIVEVTCFVDARCVEGFCFGVALISFVLVLAMVSSLTALAVVPNLSAFSNFSTSNFFAFPVRDEDTLLSLLLSIFLVDLFFSRGGADMEFSLEEVDEIFDLLGEDSSVFRGPLAKGAADFVGAM